MEDVCNIQKNDVKRTGYGQKKGQQKRNPGNEVALAQLYSALLVELKKMAEKNTTRRMTNPEFAEEQANEDRN